jgi:hypothetical protein
MKIFLDDVRLPIHCRVYMGRRIGHLALEHYNDNDDWFIVRNYDEFVDAIDTFLGQITHISFDHDLADEHYHSDMYVGEDEYYNSIKGTEKTGLDCARYFKDRYDEERLDYPKMFVHSMNPVGTEAIINLFKV